jgi:hypothetical protein
VLQVPRRRRRVWGRGGCQFVREGVVGYNVQREQGQRKFISMVQIVGERVQI